MRRFSRDKLLPLNETMGDLTLCDRPMALLSFAALLGASPRRVLLLPETLHCRLALLLRGLLQPDPPAACSSPT
jgi:hypothetical protein